MHWPALPSGDGAIVLSLLRQIEEAQWFPPETLRGRQMQQLDSLLRHAHTTVPHYREHWGNLYRPDAPLTLEAFSSLPILTRRDIQTHNESLRSVVIPPEHGPTGEGGSGGSTGTPIRVLQTQLNNLFAMAFQLRDHAWHGRDMRGKLAILRTQAEEAQQAGWGLATQSTISTGPSVARSVRADALTLLDWLHAEQPAYLTGYPSLIIELARLSIRRKVRLPVLKEVRTFGERLPPEIRPLCREAWGVPVTDMYSSGETGPIALQCPGHEHYHIHAEGLYVEILDGDGKPCAPGQTGRVVVTVLHNFAMPLVRYEIGDYAEAGGTCPCGRSLPVLNRINGRTRNMLVTAEGRQYWPLFGIDTIKGGPPITQYQLVQKAHDLVELCLVVPAPLTASEEEALRNRFLHNMPEGMRLTFAYPDAIARSASGKFEDFISEVPVPAGGRHS